MKNYPNQVSKLWRVRELLQLFADMPSIPDGSGTPNSFLNPHSDDDLGYEATRRGIYGFQNLKSPTKQQLEARIKEERKKRPGLQGARTFAREARRTIQDMGWIDHTCAVTTSGFEFLDTQQGSPDERKSLTKALLNIRADDAAGNVSHPARIMLRLLNEHPVTARAGLELALEAKDDSEAEFQRILKLYDLTPDERRDQLGISPSQQANAVKVFPSLAIAAGLVVEGMHRIYSITPDGKTALGLSPAPAPGASKPTGSPVQKPATDKTFGGKVAAKDAGKAPTASSGYKALSEDEQKLAKERLKDRTAAHQKLVSSTALLIGDDKGSFYEDQWSYDLIYVPNDGEDLILFEMKSILDDAARQVVRAVGQLHYYAFFKTPKEQSDKTVRRTLVVDAPIDSALVTFLSDQNIAVIAVVDGAMEALNSLAEEVLELL